MPALILIDQIHGEPSCREVAVALLRWPLRLSQVNLAGFLLQTPTIR